MAIQLASKTIAAIEHKLFSDQGRLFRKLLGEEILKVDSAYESEYSFPYSSKIGYSKAASSCSRQIWYGYRWYKENSVPARMIRLFNRGHLEEARFIALLRMIGCSVFAVDENGKQFRISDGQLSGALDAVIYGLPEFPNSYVLGEFKTHSDKSFKKLKLKGVKESKIEHYAQMQVYMLKASLPHSLYLAINKNDDALHGEIIDLDKRQAQLYIDRLKKVESCQTPPEKISGTSNCFECRYCDYNMICHHNEQEDINCRTCRNLQLNNGKWFCNRYQFFPSKDQQLLGKNCPDWISNQ